MIYARVINGAITEGPGRLPPAARLLVGGESVGGWVSFIDTTPVEMIEATGWFEVAIVPPPVLQPNQRATMSYVVSNGRPTQLWSVRPESTQEAIARTREANYALLSDLTELQAKMTDLKSFLQDPDVQTLLDYPNNTMPTAQQLNRGMKAVIRQERRLTNFVILLARYTLGRANPTLLDDVTDTLEGIWLS